MTNRGELMLTEYTRERPFFYTVKGKLSGKEFEYYCGVYKGDIVQETLSIDGFKDLHNFEDFENCEDGDGEEYFELRFGFRFYDTFGMKVNDFIYQCKKFIAEDFKTSDDFIIFSFFGENHEIHEIEIIDKVKKNETLYFLIMDTVDYEFYELRIPTPTNLDFKGACFKLLTDDIDDAREEFKYSHIVELQEINLWH